MLLRSPTADACPGPAPFRCLECIYSHYDGGHVKAWLKLPWRLFKLGVYPAYRYYRRRQARRVLAGALARSEFMARIHRPLLRGPLNHVPLGINLTGCPDRLPSRPRKPLRLGFLAGFQLTKGIIHVLDALASLQAEGLDFRLTLWGPGQAQGEQEIVARGLKGKVFLQGVYTPESLWSVYEQIDVAVMATTVCEPLGRVPLEGAAAGVPTIAPAIGGLTELIRHEVDGLLYRFRDPEDLKRQLRRVLTEPLLLPRLIANLPAVPDTRERVAAVEAFYNEVLAGRTKSPLQRGLP